jgi:kumamolisin
MTIKPLMVFSLIAMTAIQTTALIATAQAKPMDLVLRLKERVSIEELANNVMNPSSDRYRKFYTPEEIRALSGPTDSEYQNLLSSLAVKGMIVVNESPTHLVVTVRTDSGVVDSEFKTTLAVMGAKFAGVTQKVSIANELSLVDSITGLDQTRKLVAHHKFGNAADAKTAQKAVTQSQIKTSYGFTPIYKAGYTGAGEDISIATYDGFHMDDVVGFYKESKISPAPVIDQVQFNGTPTLNEDSAAETELDSEFSGMIAPGAKIHVFASADNSDAGELAMFTAILDDNRARVVNYSWGACETNTTAGHKADMDKLYARAIAQGVNIMVATGDSGADGCSDGTVAADWPASSPNVVAVGGTSFALKAGKLSETGWTDGGGGISKFYTLPSYQNNFQTPYIGRSYPDVAFNADNLTGEQIWTQYQTGTAHWMTIGGTSMAAPQWSGFMTLVGQARAKAGKAPLGFFNPILYSMSAATKALVLHDVTAGNNGFAAGPGWDAVTGWGSMQADQMLEYLVNQ